MFDFFFLCSVKAGHPESASKEAEVRLKSRKSCSLVQMVRVVRFLKKGGRWTVAVKRTAKLRMKREARAATR